MSFIDVVTVAKREAKGDATQDEIEWLTRSENREIWARALRSAVHEAQEQIEIRREGVERARVEVAAGLLDQRGYRAIADEYDAWIKKAQRYRLGLEQRLAEVVSQTQAEIDRLRVAIEAHRASSTSTPSDADSRLWSILDK